MPKPSYATAYVLLAIAKEALEFHKAAHQEGCSTIPLDGLKGVIGALESITQGSQASLSLCQWKLLTKAIRSREVDFPDGRFWPKSALWQKYISYSKPAFVSETDNHALHC